MQDFYFVMRLNRASPPPMRACATGQHIKSATLTGRKAGGNDATLDAPLTFAWPTGKGS